MSEDSTVGTVLLSGSSTLVFSVSQWRGKYWANVRKFIATQKYQGPTKSGLTLNRNLLQELVTTLARLEKTIPPQGESEFKTIAKSDAEHIRIGTLPDEQSGDLPWVDIREFIDTPRYQGPTKRGIRFRWNLLPDVLACFREQAEVIQDNEKSQPTLFGISSLESIGDLNEESQPTGATCIPAFLGEDLKEFPDDFLDSSVEKGACVELPETPLRLEQESTGTYLLRTEDDFFIKVRNPAEANFLIYAQLRGHREVLMPKEMIHIFRTVKAYENYLRILRSKLFAKLLRKAQQESVATYETDKLFRSLGLPKIDTS